MRSGGSTREHDTPITLPEAGLWLLLQAKPRADALARMHLENQRFECFAPRVRRSLPGPAGMRESIEPLFPRYLFVREQPGVPVDWAKVRSTRGVSALVRFGARLAKVPEAVVDGLRRWQVAHGTDLLELPAPVLKPGQRVRVCDGPLAGLTGRLAYARGTERVRVLLEVLGQPTPVELPGRMLKAS